MIVFMIKMKEGIIESMIGYTNQKEHVKISFERGVSVDEIDRQLKIMEKEIG